jgi:RNA polymerase sigma-70 factor (ECF subfamily)
LNGLAARREEGAALTAAAGPRTLDDALARLADGDRGAFDVVFGSAWPLVRSFASRLLGAEAAEDVAQRVLLRVFERCHEYDPARDATTWVVALAYWEIKTERRRRWRRAQREELAASPLELADPAADPEALALLAELRQLVATATGQLPALDADTLRAFARDERRPGPLFRKRLQRALQRLRRLLETSHD